MDPSQNRPHLTNGNDSSVDGNSTDMAIQNPPIAQTGHVNPADRGDRDLLAELNHAMTENTQLRHSLELEHQMTLIYQQDANLLRQERENMAALLQNQYNSHEALLRQQEDVLQLNQGQDGTRPGATDTNYTLEELGDQLDECFEAAAEHVRRTTGIDVTRPGTGSTDEAWELRDGMDWESQLPPADPLPTAQAPGEIDWDFQLPLTDPVPSAQEPVHPGLKSSLDPVLPVFNDFTYQDGSDIMPSSTAAAVNLFLPYDGNATLGAPPQLPDSIRPSTPISNSFDAAVPGMPSTVRSSHTILNTPPDTPAKSFRAWKPASSTAQASMHPPNPSADHAITLSNNRTLWFMNGADSVDPSTISVDEDIQEASLLINKYFEKMAPTMHKTSYGCLQQRITKRKTTFNDGDSEGMFACLDCVKRRTLCIRKGVRGFQVRSVFGKGEAWKD